MAYSPLLSVEENVNSAITPNQKVLSAFTKRAVKAPLGDPFVDSLGADLNEISELRDCQYWWKLRARSVGKSLLDFGLGQFPQMLGHDMSR
ncbi:MAG: hypothetical protein ACI9G1_003737 [Pirellulaceae bacterium]